MVYKSPQITADILENIAKSVNSNSLYEGLTVEQQEYMQMLLRNKDIRALPIDKVRKIAIAKAKSERRKDILTVLKFGGTLLLTSVMFYALIFFGSAVIALTK
ncbi:hypothetical protein [Aneurinibacillus tyrosinisolvens]|uniref:hypothetical protein n=1 Tax=Aneurinibacillus tyrosinisolvens TaxID=1443435 RepID=UPI00063F6A81|nr:hypothetical protein [Aneurinibacillus tyrosinisolvens]